jgi:hypothetical protein
VELLVNFYPQAAENAAKNENKKYEQAFWL